MIVQCSGSEFSGREQVYNFTLLCLMVIENNSLKFFRHDSEFSPGSRGSMSSEDGDLQRGSSATELASVVASGLIIILMLL